MASFEFDRELYRNQSVLWTRRGSHRESPVSMSGVPSRPKDLSAGGYWYAELNDISANNEEMRRRWSVMEVMLDGGKNPCVLRKFPIQILKRPFNFNDTFAFSNDYEDPDGKIEFAENAALRATSARFTEQARGALLPGHFFSFNIGGVWRLHQISSVSEASQPLVSFLPPLRSAVTAGVDVQTKFLRCDMRIADPDQLQMILEQNRFGTASLSFVEDFG